VYLNNPDVVRCPRKSALVLVFFFVYMLVTAIMLVNLLIAIFRLCFQLYCYLGTKVYYYGNYSSSIDADRFRSESQACSSAVMKSRQFFPRHRHLPRHRRQDTRRAKTVRIRLRRDWDAVKMFETETLPRYSYQDTVYSHKTTTATRTTVLQ